MQSLSLEEEKGNLCPVVYIYQPVGIDVREGGEWCVACIALSLTTMNGHTAEL